MSATLTVPEVHGRSTSPQGIPAELLGLAIQLHRISQEGAAGGTFVEREERAWEVLRRIYQWTLGTSLREHPLAQPGLEHRCPKCGGRLRIARKQQHRKIASRLGPISYNRDYLRCDRCGITGAALDWELGLADQAISVGLLKRVCHAAVVCRSFEDAHEILKEHALVDMSAKHVRELTENEGRRVAQARDAEAAAYAEHRLALAGPANAPKLLVVVADGGRVQTREGFEEWGSRSRAPAEPEASNAAQHEKRPDRWKEDKIGVVYDAVAKLEPETTAEKYCGAKARAKTYVATLQPWKSFGWMLRVEAQKRGYEKAKTKLFLADGAQHIREVKNDHFWDAVFILDWAHAAEHVSTCAKALFGEGTDKARGWYHEHRAMLWDGKRDELIAELEKQSRRLGSPGKDEPEGSARMVLHRDAYSYFPNNRDAIDYPSFRAKGWPIGSGVAEGAVKQFGLRMKGSEKFWYPGIELGAATLEEAGLRPSATGAEEMLALAALYHCEDGRWLAHWNARGQPKRWG